MVATTASITGNQDEAHVFCPDCWWSADVDVKQASEVVAEHEATDSHIDNELAADRMQAALERLMDKRGY